MLKKHILTFITCIISFCSSAQQKDSFQITLNGDAYFSWFTQSSQKTIRPAYLVNYTGLNTGGINFISGSIHYRSNHFRTTLSAMTGEYARQNLAVEEPFARYIYEANVGYRFTSDENIWLDIGVLPSHIGIETVPGIKNYCATRNIISDITPYYETGIRLSYVPNDEWYLAILALNGWQRITAPLHAIGKNWGMQISYKPRSNWQINSSSFIGEIPGYNPGSRTRIYSNLFTALDLNPRMKLIAGWDWGMQGDRERQWNDFILQCRYEILSKKLSFTSRYEYLTDPTGMFLIKDSTIRPQNHLASVNLDYQVSENIMFRSELNYLFANRPVLNSGNHFASNQLSVLFIASVQLNYKK